MYEMGSGIEQRTTRTGTDFVRQRTTRTGTDSVRAADYTDREGFVRERIALFGGNSKSEIYCFFSN